MSDRTDNWKAAWESRDVDRIAAMYAPDSTHESAVVARVMPEMGRTRLDGRDEIREYFRRALQRYTELRFEIISVTETGHRAAIEYLRHSNLDRQNPPRVLELVQWSGPLISAVRVFHF